jgi:hypothetical protein
MPEVKLSSLGIAGTIDLVVIDGEGRAHIFDYNNKRDFITKKTTEEML